MYTNFNDNLPQIRSKGRIYLKKSAYRFIILFGIISAFGDMTYESARSVTGPYLFMLGANAAIVGLVTGAGEFLGYALRLLSGYWVDRTKSYWTFTYIGYALLLSVPVLAFAGHWQWAALLFILERVGKAIRSPGKDTMLSFAAKQVGTGYGFGLTEAIDQIGAFIGPLLLTLSFGLTSSYKEGFQWTSIPFVFLMVILTYLRIKVPQPESLEPLAIPEAAEQMPATRKLPRLFWWYIGFSFVCMASFVNFPLLSLHMTQHEVISAAWIPVLYAVAMGVDAIIALWGGKQYDKRGIKVLLLIPALNLPIVIFGFYQQTWSIFAAVICWGALMGIQETIMKSVIADMVPVGIRGRAFSIFNISLGLAMLIGSSLMGWLYGTSLAVLIGFVVVFQIIAIALYNKCKNVGTSKAA